MPQQPEQPTMPPQQGPLPFPPLPFPPLFGPAAPLMQSPAQALMQGPAAPPMQAPAQAPMAGGAAPPYRFGFEELPAPAAPPAAASPPQVD